MVTVVHDETDRYAEATAFDEIEVVAPKTPGLVSIENLGSVSAGSEWPVDVTFNGPTASLASATTQHCTVGSFVDVDAGLRRYTVEFGDVGTCQLFASQPESETHTAASATATIGVFIIR